MTTSTNPIFESLPYDSEIPDGSQPAWHAIVHLVVPGRDANGNPVSNEAMAQDYISETLRDKFLDWGYVRTEGGDMQGPIEITVCQPYVEGTFLLDRETADTCRMCGGDIAEYVESNGLCVWCDPDAGLTL